STNRGAAVMAVGAKVIIMADTANPSPGLAPSDYQLMADSFDLVVDPMEKTNFGDVSDLDANGKVVVLYTRTVNELTPANSGGGFVGGLTAPRDLFPQTDQGN